MEAITQGSRVDAGQEKAYRLSAQGPLLSPSRAWHILRQRTGGRLARSTFYRWLESGRAYSLRVGTRIYVPWREVEEIIRKCLNGEAL